MPQPFAMTLKASLEARVREAERRGLGRRPILVRELGRGPVIEQDGKPCLSFLSNDYLGLAADPAWRRDVAESFAREAPSASASRLAGGRSRIAEEAECAYAEYFGFDECLFLPSGYQANLALVTGLLQAGQTVFADRRVHASTGHALMEARADLHTYRHGDLGHLKRRLERAGATAVEPVVLTESLFSMDGSASDPAGFASLKARRPFFLAVDEAHAAGCLGPGGRGLFAELPGTADAMLGTFGKGLGYFGAFLLLPAGFRHLLEHLASPVMHSTALPPAHARGALRLLARLPGLDGARERLADHAETFRALLAERDIPSAGTRHIVAVPVGSEAKAGQLAASLARQGILALAARFPTVPAGQAILRFSITALHDRTMLAAAADALAHALQDCRNGSLAQA